MVDYAPTPAACKPRLLIFIVVVIDAVVSDVTLVPLSNTKKILYYIILYYIIDVAP